MKLRSRQFVTFFPLMAAVFSACAPALRPARVKLPATYQQQFEPMRLGNPNELVWSVEPDMGEISDRGLYTAPTYVPVRKDVEVYAASPDNPRKRARSVVTLLPSDLGDNPPDMRPYVLTPGHVYLRASRQQQYRVSVEGVPDKGVLWSVDPQLGKISQGGLYASPDSITEVQDVTVTAVSTTYPGKQASSRVTLIPPDYGVYQPAPAVPALLPSHVYLRAARSQQFRSTLQGIDRKNIVWSIDPDLGRISQDGLYRSPDVVESPQDVIVTAVNASDSKDKASSRVTLVPEDYGIYKPVKAARSLLPSHIYLRAGRRQQFRSTIDGIDRKGLAWSVDPDMGTVSQNGVYTSPDHIAVREDVIVTASNPADPEDRASSTVTLVPAGEGVYKPVVEALTPSEVRLHVSETQQFVSTIEGETIWSISPRLGAISQDGLYTAPGLTTKERDVVVTAERASEPGRKARAYIHLIPMEKAPKTVSAELRVLFDTDKSVVKPEFRDEIKQVADFMETYPNTVAEIEGHTDSTATVAYNMGLSQRRADAVRDYLVQKLGVVPSRLKARGYGPTKPVADNGTPEGRQKNRRVVATLTAKKN